MRLAVTMLRRELRGGELGLLISAMVIARTEIGKPCRPQGGIPAIVIAQAIAIASYARAIFLYVNRQLSHHTSFASRSQMLVDESWDPQ